MKVLGAVATFVGLIAAFVTLVTAGWKMSLMIGGAILGLTLLVLSTRRVVAYLWRMWVNAAAAAVQTLRAEVEILDAANQRLEVENQRLEAENEGSQAEVKGLRKELTLIHVERKEYEEALQSVIERSPRPLREKLTITCVIGETEEGDQAREDWETEAIEDKQPILWHLIGVGAEGEAVPPKRAFRQLELVQAYESYEGRERQLRPLSVGRRGGKVWALINFDAEIKRGSPRKWSIQFRWRGMWNPLRMHGKDHYWINLAEEDGGKGVEWERVVVKFIFPSSAREPEVMVSGSPAPSKQESSDEDGRRIFAFRFENPPRQIYRWNLGVKSFDHPRAEPGRLEDFSGAFRSETAPNSEV